MSVLIPVSVAFSGWSSVRYLFLNSPKDSDRDDWASSASIVCSVALLVAFPLLRLSSLSSSNPGGGSVLSRSRSTSEVSGSSSSSSSSSAYSSASSYPLSPGRRTTTDPFLVLVFLFPGGRVDERGGVATSGIL